MAHFGPAFGTFFKNLRKNNNKEWFDAHKAQYEKEVKAPFEAFISELIKQAAKLDPAIKSTPKEAIFRIYKDVRFSKDKTPYKDYVSAIIGPGGRKEMAAPGYYVQMNDKEIGIYSGAYMPEKEYLHRIRLAIAAQPKAFARLISDKDFKKYFGEIKGEKNKIIPPELKEDAAAQPLIYHKQFYIQGDLDPKMITSDKLIPEIMKYFKAARPLNQFLAQAYKG